MTKYLDNKFDKGSLVTRPSRPSGDAVFTPISGPDAEAAAARVRADMIAAHEAGFQLQAAVSLIAPAAPAFSAVAKREPSKRFPAQLAHPTQYGQNAQNGQKPAPQHAL